MAKTAILVGGHLVRTEKFSGLTYNHKSGYLTKFIKDGKTYIHVEKVNYRSNDQTNKYATAGYYEEQAFLSYRIKIITIEQLNGFKLQIEQLPKGTIDDTVIVRKLKVKPPYTSFCKVNVISWNYTGAELINLQFQVIIPTIPAPDVNEEDVPMHTVAMAFYNRHIPLINSFFERERESAAYLISLCAIQINNIQRYIFPLFANDLLFSSYINSQNIEWTSATLFDVPELKDLEVYLSNLSGFYRSIYANQKAIINLKEMEKMYWFANVLSVQSLIVMPAYDKVELLKYVALADISEHSRLIELIRLIPVADLLIAPTLNNEQFVLKIVESVTFAPLQGNDFLNYLLFPYYIDGKKKQTLFEALYNKLDDNRTKAYSIGLLNDADNRMKYVDLIYKIWEKTSYNPYYDMPYYTQPPVFGGAYPESFFLKEPESSYFDPDKAPPFLIYETGDLSDPGKLDSSFSTSFNYQIEGVKITVEKKVITVKEFIQDNIDGTNNTSISSTTEYYGTYHLFQPVTIIGFKSDLDIKFPTEKVVPIFYINYMVQYSAIKYLDFGIVLTVEIALNFTGIGQLQNLKYFSHLKYLSRMSSSLAGENVVFWAAAQGISDAFVFTAANTASVLLFMQNTSTDSKMVAAIESANIYMGALLLASLGSSYLLRRKVIQASLDFSHRLDVLTNAGIPYVLDTATENAIRTFSGNEALVNSFMRNKLLDIPQGGTVVSVYDNFPTLIRYRFAKDFGQRGLDELALLRKTDAAPMNNYQRLAEKGLSEASSTSFLLESSRVNALIKYEEALVPDLVYNIKLAGIEKRNAFLDYFPNPSEEIFNFFKQNPAKILEFHQADAQGRRMLLQNEYFWLKCKYKPEYIAGLQPPLDAAVITVKNRGGTSWFTDPSKKTRAAKFYKDGSEWSNGEVIEVPAKIQLKNALASNEEVFANVDIFFYDANNIKIGGKIQEIDGLRFNKSTNKIEKIISMKLPNKNSWEKDVKKLTEYFFSLPDEGQQLRNYIENVLKLKQIDVSKIATAKIFYIDLRSGKELKINPSQFKLRIKSNYTQATDFERFHPETFGTTKDDLLESSYQTFKNKLQ